MKLISNNKSSFDKLSLNGFYSDYIVCVQSYTFEFQFLFSSLELKSPFEFCEHKIPKTT